MLQIFVCYLWLGCLSFGGPAAHIGYFRREFVDRRGWLSDDDFGRHLAFCQFLPGPASSQLGFLIALQRGGLFAAILAFVGFTLPSAALMYALAVKSSTTLWQSGIVAGMKLLAVVVVADAIWVMSRQFCRPARNILFTLVSALLLLWLGSPLLQMGLIALAASWAYLADAAGPAARLPRLGCASVIYLLIFVLLLLASLALSVSGRDVLVAQFYQAGSLVFGGGHVVLPLLQALIGDSIDSSRFLLGYAAAQAVPGPMFSISSFLGAVLRPQAPMLGACFATLAIFLPGFLLVLGLSPLWRELARRRRMAAAISGINAVAVGMLLAAWIDPVLGSAPRDGMSILLAVLGFVGMRSGRVPVWGLVLVFGSYGYLVL